MKKILAITLVAMVAAAVQADVWTDDFSSADYTAKVGGEVFIGDVSGYGGWGGISSAIYATENLTLHTTANADTRGAGVMLSSAEIGTGLDLTFTYDVVKVDNHANTRLYVEIWEAKAGAQSYYMDLLRSATSAPIVDTYGDATMTRRGGAVYAAADDNLVGESISFTRTDSTTDIVIMFAVGKSATWINSAIVDNISVSVVPEPATLGLVAVFGGGVLFIHRKLRI